ncbi:MAG: hypothetical protein WBC44_15710 [Planctomycetaceae bacterium]
MLFVVFRRTCLIALALCFTAFAVAQEPESEQKGIREVKVEDITLTVPADWKQGRPSNRLRLAQFVIPAVEGDKQPTELVVSYFGGGGGGVDQNIERWIGQFAGEGKTTKVTTGASKQGAYHFVDVTGTYNMPVGPPILRKTEALPEARMLGVILEVEGKGNYFLKMAGPAKTVAAAEQALRTSFGGDSKSEKPYELK